jgi:hypothetical protein|tara:strand:- start:655 stop:1452 length:798 start_codon:yes stop_codon:yes gene_type:complete
MKKVIIRRKEVQGFLPKEIRAAARVTIGSMYVGRQPLKGLDYEDSKKFLPEILGTPGDHPDFPRLEKEFWANMRVRVPFEGIELDVTVDETGTPMNLMDWLSYKWCQRHRHVADKKENMDAHHRFYIYDPNKEVLDKNNLVKIKKEADKEFIKLSNDVGKMRRVLRIFGTAKPEDLSEIEVENSLYELKSGQAERFLKIVTDKNLDLRSEIEEMIAAGVIRKIGNQHIYGEETIGENITDTVIYFKNKKNSGQVNAMRAQLKTLA